jgi:magnesium-transporting ATPase (P-type)
MITGDHPMTATYIANKSGMVSASTTLILADVVNGSPVFTNLSSRKTLTSAEVKAAISYEDTELVITGAAFKMLKSNRWIHTHIEACRIFARMSPQDKPDCVKMHMKYSFTVL